MSPQAPDLTADDGITIPLPEGHWALLTLSEPWPADFVPPGFRPGDTPEGAEHYFVCDTPERLRETLDEVVGGLRERGISVIVERDTTPETAVVAN
jgi:hypothetical protein